MRRIPRGRVATYGQVASLAGLRGAARRVGYALYASKQHHGLPWHRVIAAGGRLSVAKLDPEAALLQHMRLEQEGVRFGARGAVDMAAHQWRAGRPPTPTRTRRSGARPRAKRRRDP